MGACRWWWMPFQPPFSTAGKWCAENMNSCRNNLSTLLLYWIKQLNSLTPKSVPAGTKNSRSEGFLLAKHKHTNIPTLMEPFSSPAAWFWWMSIPTPGSLRGRGRTRPPSTGFSRINKLKEKIFYFYHLSNYFNNRSPAVGNDSQNRIH